ncbi:hypothetical protein POF50_016500 [Streptomyces sp. SL13]|jgi:hypothetical protein|uniref:Uncharacterized protein n=1 Tax=Streptantibioticus silvisoli TaxID=2705255 RepID=A0AA90GZ29_9ACTN|nr:hypothetical protein [Streptantibioticus silvisoli]MDI5964572.1 hypothetical protein [Streptantibioticus silvisoli]MDI5970923.1 hypothetical protein [Streptantibioticus silvisoli]
MAGLSVDAFAAATLPFANYLPLSTFAVETVPSVRLEQEHGIPPEHLMVLSSEDLAGEGPDVSALVLASLGAPPVEQPLFLVRSGPLRDSMVAALAQLVHEAGWAGEDVGVTHLEELGGTVVFDLLGWAVPQESGATVVICDEPLFADGRRDGRFAAVGLRLSRGAGPLTVAGCGEGPPGAEAPAADHRFGGRGPCDSWLALHEALAAGRIGAGERVLLHARGPLREGWLLLEAADPAALRLTGSASPAPRTTG